MSRWFALVDCNNFYVSCERLFRPDLEERPVAVLSNNDGCVVARSNEVKAMGIPMGEPFFHCRDKLEAHNATVFSSNYALYGDISSRIMQVLESWFPQVEVYSIDEAFLELTTLRGRSWEEIGHWLRDRIWRWIGIPVSIGVGPTKTLAKLANRKAKRSTGVLALESEYECRQLLRETPVTDIWGIGPRYGILLGKWGIHNACQLAHARDGWVQKNLTIQGLRTVRELRGEACIPLEQQPPPRQSMVCSRSFPRGVSDLQGLQAAVATYTAQLAKKLRDHGQVAQHLHVFLSRPRRKEQRPTQRWSQSIALPEANAHTPTFLQYTGRLLQALYEPGVPYRKAGVMVTGLQLQDRSQLSLWHDPQTHQGEVEMMELVDQLQRKHGRRSLFFGSMLGPTHWKMRQALRSPCYTTQWDNLLSINMDQGQDQEDASISVA